MQKIAIVTRMKDSIVQAGDPVLRQRAAPVVKKDIGSPKIKNLIRAMRKALAPEENGVAIAAPQVGVPLRMFIVAAKVFKEESKDDKQERNTVTPTDLICINPELIRTSRKVSSLSEGCLSVRGVYGTVRRHDKATLRATSEKGEVFTYHGTGLLAQIFQHEVDHLNGILFTDKAEKLETPKHEK